MIHPDDPKNSSDTQHPHRPTQAYPRVSLDPSTQWDENANLFDFAAAEDEEGCVDGEFVPFGLRRGLSGSRLSVAFARPSSAPPVEMQRLSRASSSTALPDDQTVSQDDPRRDPGYATFFHANSRLDPRLPPPIYAPGQSWQQIWNGSIPESISKIRPGPIPEDDDEDEFGYLQQQIASSSAGSSSSSSLTGSPSAAAHRKRLVDMIQEDFPRTPSPVYARAPAMSMSLATLTTTRSMRSSAATAGSSVDDFLTFNMQSMGIEDPQQNVQMPSITGRPNNGPSGVRGRLAPPALRFGRHASMPVQPSPVPPRSNSAALVEEIKTGLAGRNRHIELAELAGHLVRLSVDQHGSRFIQQRLESAVPADRDRVFSELLPHALDLMTDVFGNYVIQKFFEHGSPVQQETLCGLMKGHVLPLALQMYGCRVVQKALEHGTPLCRSSICTELEGSVMRLVKDQNGNHVIQKCIECVPVESAPFLAASFSGQVYALATHPYGCRVIQRFFEHAPSTQTRPLIDELLRFTDNLVRDQYGNYVIQHLIERGEPADRDQIISRITGCLLDLSRHKFASNVVEKAVQYSGPAYRQSFLEELLAPLTVTNTETGQPEESFALLLMMRDQFANYVVQKMLDLLDGSQRTVLLERIKPHLPALRKYTYGKHIIAKVDRLLLEQQQQQRK